MVLGIKCVVSAYMEGGAVPHYKRKKYCSGEMLLKIED
jgi:hypothetical protein